MSAIKPATVWWCLEELLSPDEIIATSARLGYAGIEMAPPEHWPGIREAGLQIVSHRGHGMLVDGMNRIENHDRIAREIGESIELAHAWNVPVLICFSGNRNGLGDEEGAENTAKCLERVAALAADAGITLALELLNSKVDHPDYQCDRTAWGVKVIEMVGSPAVRLLYDIYHMQIMEGDIIRTIQDSHQHFGHYHLAGNPGRHEPDPDQEINFPPILRAIQTTGYNGYLGMEYVPQGDPAKSLAASRSLARLSDIAR